MGPPDRLGRVHERFRVEKVRIHQTRVEHPHPEVNGFRFSDKLEGRFQRKMTVEKLLNLGADTVQILCSLRIESDRKRPVPAGIRMPVGQAGMVPRHEISQNPPAAFLNFSTAQVAPTEE